MKKLAAFLLGLAAAVPAAAELTPAEQRGKAIYFQGESVSGREILAVIGDAGTEVPAAVMTCSSCHGRDGRGRPEGGVYPTDLTWPALTKPYGVEHASGRRHPPYSEKSLVRAIAMGVDPAGNRLHVAMPIYRMAHEDMADLIAYIQRLGEDLDPGLTDDAVTLATMLPKDGPLAGVGAAMEAVMRAYFADVNEQGGIYHRRLELEVVPAVGTSAARAADLDRLLESDAVFALAGVFLAGAEDELLAVVEEHEIPLVGPYTLDPRIDFYAPNPYVFYLLPGIKDLARSLVSFAKVEGEPPHSAVLAGADPILVAAADEVVRKAAELGWPEVRRVTAGPGELDVETLAQQALDPVFLLVAGDGQTAFLKRAAELGWHPRVLVPGPLLEREIFAAPPGFADRIFAAFPTLPSNHDPRSVSEYRRLAEHYRLPAEHVAVQVTTLASARVLVEGLKQAGRQLSRGRLIEVLEGLSEFDTGLTPPVSYSPNRRIGVRGAYVLAIDLEGGKMTSASGWIDSR
jgi:ABC-type branched-subunit amino acid transport system substrate-binding protein